MAQNQSHESELLDLLSDVKQRRFQYSRQINPNSMFYQTVKFAVTHHYFKNVQIDDPVHALASVDLTQATLSTVGVAALTNLISAQRNKEEE